MTTAVVLAGGGVAGVAWEIGVLQGVRDVDPELAMSVANADIYVGTSAGSVVATQVATGGQIDELYERQLAPAHEIHVDINLEGLLGTMGEATQGAATRAEAMREIGKLALSADTVDEATRLAVIAGRLPSHTWPGRDLKITAVDAESGELMVFTRDSGVELVSAVAASCAVPGVWPTVTIDGHRYMDGGMYSISNADLATGADRVLIITPQPAELPPPFNRLEAEIEALRPAQVHVINADEASWAAFGTNPLAPSTRTPSAQAGREVGKRAAAALGDFWR